MWILGEYCTTREDIQSVMTLIRQSLGEVNCLHFLFVITFAVVLKLCSGQVEYPQDKTKLFGVMHPVVWFFSSVYKIFNILEHLSLAVHKLLALVLSLW